MKDGSPNKLIKQHSMKCQLKQPQRMSKMANEGLFHAKMTLPAAAKHCGMTHKEMKLTFFEYLKYHPPIYVSESQHNSD